MQIKIDTSYFELKTKPSLLHPLTLNVQQKQNQLKVDQLSWDFRNLDQFSQINDTVMTIKSQAQQLIIKIANDQEQSVEDEKNTQVQVIKLLQQVKDLVQKCEYFNITLSSYDLLSNQSGLLNFYKYPDSFRICTLLTEIQRSLKGNQLNKDALQIEKNFPWIEVLQKVTAKQLLVILKSLKDNIYIPSAECFTEILQKLHFKYDGALTLKENMTKNSYNLNQSQYFPVYYQLLIYRECSTLEGLGYFLSYTKNILLDRKSGALAAQHQTWVALFDTCLKLYSRNPQVRLNNWLEIDQILSTTFMDEEFTNFLINSKVEDFSLASLNFYIKNLSKSDQLKLLKVAQNKINSLFDSGLAWKEAEDIVEHLDNQCQGEIKQKIYNKIIKLIDSIFLSDVTLSKSNSELIQIQIGLTFFIESMCKHLQVSHKIFNKTNLNLIISTLKNSQNNQAQIRLLYHIFTEFIINSYQESDQLSTYLEANQDIVVQILPQIAALFNTNNYLLPKQLYKLIFHSVEDIETLKTNIWRGIAELYFVQCFEETIDLQIFHSQNEAKQKIADHIVQILKELTMNNAKQHIIIAQALNNLHSHREELQNFLQFKAFKDQLIFNNGLMMSTFFGEYLLLSDLSAVLTEFYTPIVADIKWKSSQQQSLTLLSYIAEQLPIDVLKATYKFLKQGFTINIKSLQCLSAEFWSTYFSSDPHSKVQSILGEAQISYETYQSLHSLRLLDLTLNMINCVFDKLNEHSQKSIKQLKVMYEWGIVYIKELQPQLYPILINCLVNKFHTYQQQIQNDNVELFDLYDRKKNISILDMHMYEKVHIFQTFNDFNKIGHVICHEKAPQVSLLIYPCFTRQLKIQTNQKVCDETSLLKTVFQLILMIENSCLEEVMNDDVLAKVSKMHILNQKYCEKVIPLINQFKKFLSITSENHSPSAFKLFIEKPLYKRLVSHLKLLMGKIYIPLMIRQAFSQNQSESSQNLSKKLKTLDQKFTIIKSFVEVIHNFDPLFEEHFAQLMQVIEENSQNKEKKTSTQLNDKLGIRPQILTKTLEMFFKCVLQNIKVRSFHIFKLIKLYLSQTKTELQQINQVIKFYIDMLYGQFIDTKQGQDYNEEVRQKSKPINHGVSQSKHNSNDYSRIKILTPKKSKENLSFVEKIISPLRKDKISLEELRMKKQQKSTLTPQKEKQNIIKPLHGQNHSSSFNSSQDSSFQYEEQLPQQIKKLIIRDHSLTTVQSSCTLSMFINLFARLNYSSLPTGVQHLLSKENDKTVYLDYLIELTHRLLKKEQSALISQRDLEILSVDVYGNLSCILKGKLNQHIFKKFIQLAKMTLSLKIADQNLITLPIKLLNQRLFAKTHPKITHQTNFYDFAQISKLITEFEEEPLAYELSIKSHIIKISPFIKSNLHLCNLEYIIGQNKSSISKKIIETNYKLLENIMGRSHSRQYLKKYEKSYLAKESLNISLLHPAMNEMDKILNKFTSLYSKIDISSETQTVQLYFNFKKICSLLFYAPQLFSYIAGKNLTVNNNQMTLIDIVFDTLKYTLVFFCEFYIICLKINSGFCSKQELSQIIRSTESSTQKSLIQNTQNLPERIPLNFVIQVYIKLRLLHKVKVQNEQNLNSLRALNFIIKQSQKYRFRFYKFIKINVPETEEFLKKFDEQIFQSLLKDIKRPQELIQVGKEQNFINKVELMDLCLQNLLSHTMFDYAKMKLDEKLKDTFVNSQYSIKCLQSFNCDIKTLKILEQAEEQKSVSSGCDIQDLEDLQNDIISENILDEQLNKDNKHNVQIQKENVFMKLETINNLVNKTWNSQIHRPKAQSETLSLIEFTSDLQPFSVKQTSELKQWLKLTVTEQSSNSFTSSLLKEMQKICQKLIGKQNMSFNFEDPIYLQSPHNTDQIDITTFAMSDPSNTQSDCCIDEMSFVEQHNQGMIVQEEQKECSNVQQPIYDGICEDEVDCDCIIEEEDDSVERNEDWEGDAEIIKISIVEQTHVNRFRNYETQNGDAIVEMQDPSEEEHQSEQQMAGGTDGSIEFTSSIKTLDNIDDIQIQQVSQQLPLDSIPTAQQPPQVFINNQPRQFHYTIDNFTSEPQQNRLNPLANNNNSSLVDTISAEIAESDEPVTKESIFNLIEEYTLNPEVLKVIKLKIKKISNSQLKKVHGLTHGDLKDQVERQMRTRGLYVALAPGQYESPNEGSLFSISRLINESFQIDESKFYATNYKRCDKKTKEKQKIQKIPQLSFNQWVNFVFLYLVKSKQNELKGKIETQTLLEGKNLGDLLIKLLLQKQNLVRFLEVLLNLLSCEKVQQTLNFLSSHMKLPSGISECSEVLKSIPAMVLNELVAKLITNRIGLPVLLKGKWNYESKRLIKYEFQCLISDSNLNNNRSQGEPLLQVFLRKSIELIYSQQALPKQDNQKPVQLQTFVKSLSEYFKCVQNFQSNQYPYYFIQDTIKLTCPKRTFHNDNNLSLSFQPKPQYSLGAHGSRSRISLCESLLNAMKVSSLESIRLYEEVFYLMNYLDFQTFSEFLELLIHKHRPLCEKLIDKELNILKRFKKSAYSENLNKEKLPQLYWHMRKSSKSFLSTDQEQKQLEFFAKIMSLFSSTIFHKFKESIFKFGYGKEQNKKKQKISYLNKLLMNPSYENKFKSIREQIAQNQKQYLLWKLTKNTEILREDVLPIIQKIAASFNDCLKKWQILFEELEDVFGTEKEEKFILYKQCSEFYKIFLSFEMLLQSEETSMIRTMSSLKTKPSLQSTRDMGITGRRRSSLKLPRVSLASSIQLCTSQINLAPTFKSVFKTISPKFSFFSQMIDETCPQLRIHAKYSTIESKLKLLHQKNKGGQVTIEVRRDHIWQDTLPFLNEDIADKNVKIKIAQELGLDYGGIRREWITLLVKQLFNPNLGLFQLSVNGLAFQPSSLSYLVPNHMYYFYKLGILVGKALKENWLLQINFTKSFLKHILGYTLYVEDLEDIDPNTSKSLLWMLNNDVGDGDLGIDFTHSYDVLGRKVTIELIEDGKDTLVTEDNKKDYVKLLAVYKMTSPIREQSKAFMSGLQKVVSFQTLNLFSYKQLGIYLAGMPTVDVHQMKKYTRYQGFTQEDQSVKWFWEALSTYTEQQKANFLFFLTGSYKVPYGGFRENPISINKMPASIDYLPVAHTCFSVIDLPEYSSKQKLVLLLDKAVKEGKGFSVS